MEISEHCRLCLVKDEVNIPIFEDEGDVRQVLLKITACLPVKIAKSDSLPKRICDGCLYKLESFYQFWNTSVNSEKQLLQWLSETLNGDAEANLHALKQEPTDNLQSESQVFIQQQLAYQSTENYGDYHEETNYKQKKTPTKKERDREKREREKERKREEAEAEEEEEEEEEAPAPKRKRRAATKKPAIEIDDDDDDEEYVPPSAAITKVKTKTEDDSEGNDDPGEDYGGDENASDDNLDDDTEPGPSGTTKSTSDAPYSRMWRPIRTKWWTIDDNADFRKYQKQYHLKKAIVIVGDMREFNSSKHPLVYTNAKLGKLTINQEPKYGMEVSNIIASMRNKYKCDVCSLRFQTYVELKYHAISHEGEVNESLQRSLSNIVQYPITVTALAGSKPFFNLTAVNTLPNDEAASSDKYLECDVCGANFNNNGRYEAHIILHKKFSCTNCSARFSTSAELVAHAMEIHNTVHEDVISQKPPAKDGNEAEPHKEPHTCINQSEGDVLKYRCKVCNRRFADCFQLQRHKRMHSKDVKVSEERQVTKVGCDLCNLEFSLKEDMLEHRKGHLKPINTVDDDDDVVDDDEIVIVSTYNASDPMNSVINLDSSDSDSELIINTTPMDTSESPASVVMPSPKLSNTRTTVMNRTKSSVQKSVRQNKQHTIVVPGNVTTASVEQQIIKPIPKKLPINVNDKSKSVVNIRCLVCNFVTTNEDVMNEHHKVHSIPNLLTAAVAPSAVVDNVTLNSAINQMTNILTKTGENSTIGTEHLNTISTTTITTPSSIAASPSTSWGNQLVFISPSNTGSQIIQHPIFIIPGSNSSNNTSNVDINIRTTNEPNIAPKVVDSKKVENVLTRPPPNLISPAFGPHKKTLRIKKILGPNAATLPSPLCAPATCVDSIADKNPPVSNYVIKIVNENTGGNNAASQNTINENRYMLVQEAPDQTAKQPKVDASYDEVITDGNDANDSSTTFHPVQTDIQKPKISVKPLSLLMKSPIKSNTLEVQPASVHHPAIFTASPTPGHSSVEYGENVNTPSTDPMPKLTAISKAQLISLLTKKTLSISNKSTLPNVNAFLQCLNSSSDDIDIVARTAPPTIFTATTAPPTIFTPTIFTATTAPPTIAPPTIFIETTAPPTIFTPTTAPPTIFTATTDPQTTFTATTDPQTTFTATTAPSTIFTATTAPPTTFTATTAITTSTIATTSTTKIMAKPSKATTKKPNTTLTSDPKPCSKKSESPKSPGESAPLVERSAIHKCGSCSFEAKKRGKLHAHCKFKCKTCQFISCKLINLDTHYETAHNIQHMCCPCDIVFPVADALVEHKNQVHICPNCKKCQIDLAKHVNGFKCPLCTFATCKQNVLTSHYKATHNIVRNCAPCNIAFGSIADFEDHKYSMHFCSKCGTYKMNLNVHKIFCRGDEVKILDRVESEMNLEVIELD